MCGTVMPNGDGSTYADMYFAKNFSGKVQPPAPNATMISGNQGNATCWGTADCQPGGTCQTKLLPNLPNGVGVCVPNEAALQPQNNCHSQADVGKSCGGYSGTYSDGLGYSCVSYGTVNSDVVCLPAYHPPVSGLGKLDGNDLFWTGTGSPMNTQWRTAAMKAGNGTPWYEIFTNACPNTYGWQYTTTMPAVSTAIANWAVVWDRMST